MWLKSTQTKVISLFKYSLHKLSTLTVNLGQTYCSLFLIIKINHELLKKQISTCRWSGLLKRSIKITVAFDRGKTSKCEVEVTKITANHSGPCLPHHQKGDACENAIIALRSIHLPKRVVLASWIWDCALQPVLCSAWVSLHL